MSMNRILDKMFLYFASNGSAKLSDDDALADIKIRRTTAADVRYSKDMVHNYVQITNIQR